MHPVQSGALVRELLRMQAVGCALKQTLDQFRRQEAQLWRQHRAAAQTHHSQNVGQTGRGAEGEGSHEGWLVADSKNCRNKP